jgi:excisionase family DNA binding protein
MFRMRLINDAYKEIKAADPETAITKNYIRRLIVSGVVPSTRCGTKYLVNMDTLESYLSNPDREVTPINYGKIRAVAR